MFLVFETLNNSICIDTPKLTHILFSIAKINVSFLTHTVFLFAFQEETKTLCDFVGRMRTNWLIVAELELFIQKKMVPIQQKAKSNQSIFTRVFFFFKKP